MAQPISDEAFARAVNQMGAATVEQVEAARQVQASRAQNDVLLPLAEILIRQGVITPALRANIERKLQAAQQGGIQQLGQYKLIRKLGEGGMGAVYLAEDLNVGRKVALKVLPKRFAGESEFLTRFKREAQATGKLNHVNIVAAYASGEDLGHHYYAMEYCEGQPLDSILKRDKVIAPEKALEVVMQVARGLKHAHEHGFIHRDIKPANVFMTDSGVAKILDLGLSKDISDSQKSFNTQTGVALGTPHYISPEQARGDKVIDGRTDIYSLGAMFYHLVTGETPFQGSTAALIMMKHLNDQLANPQDINEQIPDGVAHVIQKMMAKEPDDRYRDCSELLADLELVIDGKMPSSHAVEAGKSSVAMRQKLHPPRRTVAAGTRQHSPVGVRQNDERKRAAKPKSASNTPMYLMLGGVGVGAIILVLVMMTAGNPKPEAARHNDANPPEMAETPPVSTVPIVKTPPIVPKVKPDTVETGVDDAWVKSVQALPAEQQVGKVIEKLRELNPGYDGAEKHVQSTELYIESEALADISPLRALRGLQILQCSGIIQNANGSHSARRNRVSDISPLKGMALTRLDIHSNMVADLSPLRGMLLTDLNVQFSAVADLSPLQGMPLTSLNLISCNVRDLTPLAGMQLKILVANDTPVADLAPLRGMPLMQFQCGGGISKISDLSPLEGKTLKILYITGAKHVTDLSPLKGAPLEQLSVRNVDVSDIAVLKDMPLKWLTFYGNPAADLTVLRNSKTLKQINGMPVAEFWAKNGGAPPGGLDDAWVKSVQALPPQKQVDAVLEKLKELNGPGVKFVHYGDNNAIWAAHCSGRNITPLKGFPALRSVVLNGGEANDISALAGMTLNDLQFAGCPVSDVSPLRGMKLLKLWMRGSKVADLKPIVDLPIKDLTCNFVSERDTEILKSMKSLEWINNLSVAEFWAKNGGVTPTISNSVLLSEAFEKLNLDSLPPGYSIAPEKRKMFSIVSLPGRGKVLRVARKDREPDASIRIDLTGVQGHRIRVSAMVCCPAGYVSPPGADWAGPRVVLQFSNQTDWAKRLDPGKTEWDQVQLATKLIPIDATNVHVSLAVQQVNAEAFFDDLIVEIEPAPNSKPPVLEVTGTGVFIRPDDPAAKLALAQQTGTHQSETLPKEMSLDLGGGVKMEMVLVPAGEFMMGDDTGKADEKPAHKVKISQPYYIGKYEVTVAQFQRFAEAAQYATECERNKNKGYTVKDGKIQEISGSNWKMPGFEQNENHPVVLVSWNDIQAFVAWAGKQSGRDMCLPNEGQWEYAARGTENRKYPWGNNWNGTLANHSDTSLKNAGFQGSCTSDNDGFVYTSPVGNYKNASWCGAFDMAGNVSEWVDDKHQVDYYSKSPSVDPAGGDGRDRVYRGGSWDHLPADLRATHRFDNLPGYRASNIGFRVAMHIVTQAR